MRRKHEAHKHQTLRAKARRVKRKVNTLESEVKALTERMEAGFAHLESRIDTFTAASAPIKRRVK